MTNKFSKPRIEEHIEDVMERIKKKGEGSIDSQQHSSSPWSIWQYILFAAGFASFLTAAAFLIGFYVWKSATIRESTYQPQATAVQMIEVPPTAISTLEAIVRTSTAEFLPYLNPPASTIFPQELVAELATYGFTSEAQVQACVDKAHTIPNWIAVKPNETVPANAVFATNFDEAGRKWSEFPVNGICYSGSWGLFQSTKEFIAPYNGAYWLIATPISKTAIPAPTIASPNANLREHIRTSVGTGALSDVIYSDGMAPYSEAWLWANNHFNIQRIRIEEQPSGCDIATYDADKIWITSGYKTDFLVNDQVIGHYNYKANSHGFILSYPVKKGDKLCVSEVQKIGFSIIIGPDIYWHYDSYCYRGWC